MVKVNNSAKLITYHTAGKNDNCISRDSYSDYFHTPCTYAVLSLKAAIFETEAKSVHVSSAWIISTSISTRTLRRTFELCNSTTEQTFIIRL